MSHVDAAPFIAKLEQWSKLIFRNAEQLYEEAGLLGSRGSFARAAALHQLSIEECSKIDEFGAAAMSFAMGRPINLERLIQRLRDHKFKNYNNAYFSAVLEDERAAYEAGDHTRARAIFRGQQQKLHKLFNDRKNAALYTDFKGGECVTPEQSISEADAVEMQHLNAFYLKHGMNHVRLLERLVQDPAATLAPLTELASRLEDSGVDPAKMNEAFTEWLEEQTRRLAEEKPGRGVEPLG